MNLEFLAYKIGQNNYGHFIQSVYDQFSDFIALQNNLFILNHKNSYVNLENSEIFTRTSQQIFSVFLALNEIPFVIASNRNKNSAEYNLAINVSGLFKNVKIIENTRKRPLLIVLNRNFDVFSSIGYSWSYNSLISDLLDFGLNKITIQKNIFELNDNDSFWFKNISEQFTVVSERIESELLALKKELATKCIDDKTDKNKMDKILEKAPELAQKNESIKAHMHICLEIVNIVRKRGLDDFYRLENTNSIKDEEILEISEKGTENDIIRLALKLKGKISDEVLKAMLGKRNIDTKILNYSIFNKDTQQNEQGIRQRMFTSIVGNVKKLLPFSNEPKIYSVVEDIYNQIRNGRSLAEQFIVKDPVSDKSYFFDNEISKIVVIVLGSGNIDEFNSLKILENRLNIPIIYGCDELLNSEGFLNQVIYKNQVI